MQYGHLFVLLPIIAAFVTDSGAYFTGVTIGKKKAFPTISPNKTVEGYIGGTIAGTAGMLIYGIILSYTTPLTIIFPALIIYGILGALVTEAGDLTFSLIKRKCGIKDYGSLMPGHGGALDRFDSMSFAAPTMYLLVMLVPAIII
jgi:phosphatidate cytidylyltransferase